VSTAFAQCSLDNLRGKNMPDNLVDSNKGYLGKDVNQNKTFAAQVEKGSGGAKFRSTTINHLAWKLRATVLFKT
jgi:hypothetical protein